MSVQELKQEIHKVVEEVPEPVLNEVLEFLKHIKDAAEVPEKYPPLDYSKYQFETKDLKFNRDEINER